MHNSALRHEYQEQSKRINNGFETLWVNGKKKKKKKKHLGKSIFRKGKVCSAVLAAIEASFESDHKQPSHLFPLPIPLFLTTDTHTHTHTIELSFSVSLLNHQKPISMLDKRVKPTKPTN
jgi:hypothetical protein